MPFSIEQFLNVFQKYNQAVYPMQIIFYLLAILIIVLSIRKSSSSDKIISGILSFFWIWMGIVYHILFFTTINKAAYLFGSVFILEGILIFYYGVMKNSLTFRFNTGFSGITGAILIFFALIVYPVTGYFQGHIFPASPTFGLPCPTTIFTLGLFLLCDKKFTFAVLIIPVLWSVLGFSAAFSLGIKEDIGLIVAGLLTAILIITRRTKRQKINLFIFFLLLMIGCTQSTNTEGFINVTGGKVWYRIAGKEGKTPIVMLHGGPAYTSYYLVPLLPLGKDRPVIIFDQLGCGRSDRITDTTLMTTDTYVEQTKQILDKLNIREFYLYGHSWGTMLATDFVLKYPVGVKALILESPCISAEMWVKDADTIISSLPAGDQVLLRDKIKGIVHDSVKLQKAITDYFSRCYNRKPVSGDVKLSAENMGANVYKYMWGDNEFYSTGTLRTYDRTRDLASIKTPVLYMTGEFDAARPSTVRYYQSLTPGAEMVIIPGAGHMTMNDNPEADIKAIAGFLSDIER